MLIDREPVLEGKGKKLGEMFREVAGETDTHLVPLWKYFNLICVILEAKKKKKKSNSFWLTKLHNICLVEVYRVKCYILKISKENLKYQSQIVTKDNDDSNGIIWIGFILGKHWVSTERLTMTLL